MNAPATRTLTVLEEVEDSIASLAVSDPDIPRVHVVKVLASIVLRGMVLTPNERAALQAIHVSGILPDAITCDAGGRITFDAAPPALNPLN